MKTAGWIAGAFVAGLVVSAAATRAKADTPPIPAWVAPGACYIAPNVGNQLVLEVQGTWVKVERSSDGTENWTNLAAMPWLRRLSDDTCRHMSR